MEGKKRCTWAESNPLLKDYHDHEYGFKIKDDILYFERLILEIFQAGLSWLTILKKREAFRKAFDNFDFYKVSSYDENKIQNLLNDKGIIRNKLKIKAAVLNAEKFIEIINEKGSFDNYMNTLPINNREEIIEIFRKTFKFTGPLIIEEFMMSTGFWPVKHDNNCFLKEPSLFKKTNLL
jgi:DNA-3-methyladenine glycosylase I